MEFNFKDIKIDTLKITFEDGKSLTLRTPKLKLLKRAGNIKKDDGAEAINEMIEVVAAILSNNKENRTITTDFVENEFDTSELISFLTHYFKWIGKVRQDPNF